MQLGWLRHCLSKVNMRHDAKSKNLEGIIMSEIALGHTSDKVYLDDQRALGSELAKAQYRSVSTESSSIKWPRYLAIWHWRTI